MLITKGAMHVYANSVRVLLKWEVSRPRGHKTTLPIKERKREKHAFLIYVWVGWFLVSGTHVTSRLGWPSRPAEGDLEVESWTALCPTAQGQGKEKGVAGVEVCCPLIFCAVECPVEYKIKIVR